MKYLSLNKHTSEKKVYQHEIKQTNLKRAFDLIRNGVCTSRSELSREMQLSATAVSSLTDELIRQNLVLETGPIHAETPGRRPMSLKLNAGEKQIAVLSMGKTCIHFTLFDLALNVLEEENHPYGADFFKTPDRGEAYADLFIDILKRRSARVELDRLLATCVSFPGIYLSHEAFYTARAVLDTIIKPESLRRFTEEIGSPAFIANLSMCMAYAEKKLLDASGEQAENLLFVNISDCVGSAMIVNGNIYTGPNDTAGDIGHVRVGGDGWPCPCGGEDCLHHYLNLNALLQAAQEACAAEQLPAPENFASLAEQYGANPAVDRAISKAAQRLGFALSVMVSITGISRIVVGGGIRALDQKFLDEVSRHLCKRIYSRHHNISFAQTGDSADSLGIAQYLLDKTDEILTK